MANSFYWYDLETSGLSPKWDRIVQFAGCRTDAELNLLDDEYITYVSLPDDVLPEMSHYAHVDHLLHGYPFWRIPRTRLVLGCKIEYRGR